MKKVLFLGYNKNQTKIINFIKKNRKDISLKQTSSKINLKSAIKFDLIISFGYRHIIPEEVIKRKKNIINLHIGYLPYNRGAHPNFWSFVENTPAGITIHKVNKDIDKGDIIFQKQIDFNILKNRKNLTFALTQKKLINEIENLFIKNVNVILNSKYKSYKQIGKGTIHFNKDLPPVLKSWKQNIYKTTLSYDKYKKNFIKNKLQIIDKIESARKSNNLNWMNIIRNSLEISPNKTLKILKKINVDDKKISYLFKKINED